MTAVEDIERYTDHLQDLTYIQGLLDRTATRPLYDILGGMLRSGLQSRILATDLFIRDLVLLVPPEMAPAFREGFYTSTLVDALDKNVFANMHCVRADTVYTIGKTYLKGSLNALTEAFGYYLERDPLLLSRLLGELHWLGDTHQWSLIERMAHSSLYLTRWATLSTYLFDYFRPPTDEEDISFTQWQEHYLEQLRIDSHPLVRGEAEYKFREFCFSQTAHNQSRAERRREKKALKSFVPPIDFESVHVRFHNAMWQENREDYTVAELETFVNNL